MTLKRLSLSVLRPGEAAAAATQPGVAPAGPDRRPAAFTRQNVRLVLATRLQVSKLSAVEAVLLGATTPHGTEPPSVLRGSVVRFVSKGRYQLDRVASTQLDENGELVLTLQDFERPIPLICISSTSSLDDDRLFQKHGRAELAALAAGVARSGSAPTLRELAATCHRLCLGWLWSDQLDALRSAVHKDAAAVAALLEPPAAVAALLPCFEDSVGAAAASKASPTIQAGLPPLPAEGAKLHATGADQPQAGTGPAVSAAGHDASASAETGPSKGSEQQQQQQHRRQQDAGASPSAAKKQRTDSNAKGSTPAAPPLEPGELPPAEEEQKQRQQRQQRAQQVGSAVQRQSQKPQTVPPPPPPAGAAAGGGGGGGGAAAGAAAAGMEAGAQGSSRKHRFEQQEALPSHIMPPGGKLESLLIEAVGLVDMQFGGQLRQVGDLGNKLATLDKGWKQQVPSSCGLAKLVMELNRRGLVQAQARDGNVYVRKLPARAPPPQLNPLPPTLPPAFAPYFAPTSNILPQNVRFTF